MTGSEPETREQHEVLDGIRDELQGGFERLRDELELGLERFEGQLAAAVEEAPDWLDVEAAEIRAMFELDQESLEEPANLGPRLGAVLAGRVERFVETWFAELREAGGLNERRREELAEEAARIDELLGELPGVVDETFEGGRAQLEELRDRGTEILDDKREAEIESLEDRVDQGELETGPDAREERARVWEEQRRRADALDATVDRLAWLLELGAETSRAWIAEVRRLVARATRAFVRVEPELRQIDTFPVSLIDEAVEAPNRREEPETAPVVREPSASAEKSSEAEQESPGEPERFLRKPPESDRKETVKSREHEEAGREPSDPVPPTEPLERADDDELADTIDQTERKESPEERETIDQTERKESPEEREPPDSGEQQEGGAERDGKDRREGEPTPSGEETTDAGSARSDETPETQRDGAEGASEGAASDGSGSASTAASAEMAGATTGEDSSAAGDSAEAASSAAQRSTPSETTGVRLETNWEWVSTTAMLVALGPPACFLLGFAVLGAAHLAGVEGAFNPVVVWPWTEPAVAVAFGWLVATPLLLGWRPNWRGWRFEFVLESERREETELTIGEDELVVGRIRLPWREVARAERMRWEAPDESMRGWVLELEPARYDNIVFISSAANAAGWRNSEGPVIEPSTDAWQVDERVLDTIDRRASGDSVENSSAA